MLGMLQSSVVYADGLILVLHGSLEFFFKDNVLLNLNYSIARTNIFLNYLDCRDYNKNLFD